MYIYGGKLQSIAVKRTFFTNKDVKILQAEEKVINEEITFIVIETQHDPHTSRNE